MLNISFTTRCCGFIGLWLGCWIYWLFGETSPGWVYNSGAGLYGLSNWVYHWSLGRGQCTTAPPPQACSSSTMAIIKNILWVKEYICGIIHDLSAIRFSISLLVKLY